MRKKLPSLTIGIPAFNEQENIGHLLRDLVNQTATSFRVEKIIVASDSSTDNTVKIVKKFAKQKVEIIDNKDRKGQAARQNQIIDETTSDILVLLNADILIEGKDFIKKLISPILVEGADLTSSNLRAMPPRTFVGKMLNVTLGLRNNIYENHRSGQNIYTCHGAARAFSRKFYKRFRFDGSTAEDAFSYLSCVTSGCVYKYSKGAVAYIRWPETVEDHHRQSLRFFQSIKILNNSFGRQVVSSEYTLPKTQVTLAVIKFFLSNPLHALVYSFMYWYTAISSIFVKPVDTWKVSQSSKKLI